MANDNKFIQQALGEDFMQTALAELGLQNSTPENQATIIAFLGENILKRVTLEILSVLPEDARDEFTSLVGSDDAQALYAFVGKHIEDLEGFVREYATQEYEATKTTIHTLREKAE
jgi:hypothetical protein